MAKTTFAEFSTTPADNTDINGIGVQGTNAVQNFDNAFREVVAILRRDVPGLALANTFTKTQTWTKGTDVASATSLTLGDGNYFDITGTTAITSIATKGIGTVVILQFDAALTLTHHATDLILPTGANITTAAGDHAAFVEYASGDWRCFSYQKANGEALALAPQASIDVASATTTDIGAVASQNVRVTGTTTITGLGTVAAGTFRRILFAGALTLTHNGTSLILPGAENITTAAGDIAEFISEGSGNWRCTNYQRAASTGWETIEEVTLSAASSYIKTGLDDFYELWLDGYLIPSAAASLNMQFSVDNGSNYQTTSDHVHQGVGVSTATAQGFSSTTSTGFTLSAGGTLAASDNTTLDAKLFGFNKSQRLRGLFVTSGINNSSTIVTYILGLWTPNTTAGQTARNALRIVPSSGNLSGKFTLFGKRG